MPQLNQFTVKISNDLCKWMYYILKIISSLLFYKKFASVFTNFWRYLAVFILTTHNYVLQKSWPISNLDAVNLF